uniref:Uncharacterized protein n=1 Tax=Rhizophora mucronata TaxID=61149 RepID=A0A2P2IWX4_RHIMU
MGQINDRRSQKKISKRPVHARHLRLLSSYLGRGSWLGFFLDLGRHRR